MRGAHRPGPAAGRPLPTVAVVAACAATMLLAACSTGRPANTSGTSGNRPPGGFIRHLGPGGPVKFRAIGPGQSNSVTIHGPPGGGPGQVTFVGPAVAGGPISLLPVGPAGGTGRPHIVVGSIPPANSGQTIALPLDSYEQVSAQGQQALSAAGDLLTQRCMAAKGFVYTAAAQPGSGAANLESIEDGGYGVASLTQAEVYGYKNPGGGNGGGPVGIVLPAFLGQQSKHGQAWTSALLGFVPGSRPVSRQPEGCLQESDLELYGKLSGNPNPDPVPGIAFEAASWTQSDPRIQLADRLWSACMARKGYTYKSPQQAEYATWPSEPTSAEIATAVADVRCKTQTNFVNTWLTVEAAYQSVLISQNLTELARLQTNFGKLLDRADAALRLPFSALLPLLIRGGRATVGRGYVKVSRGGAAPVNQAPP
jgi:hypothetical protein